MPLTPLNVLLADEETTIVELFGEYLRVSGHEVRVVRRAEDLPDALARVDLDVVVLDEGLAGGELVEHLHAREVLARDLAGGRDVVVSFAPAAGAPRKFTANLRIDTPQEAHYYRHGGILPYVVRQMVQERP